MSGSSDPRWGDDARNPHDGDPREYGDRYERDHGCDLRDRDPDDPRDVLLDGLDLPRGLEREVVWDHDQTYNLDSEDSRNLATVGTFRVVPEGDLQDDLLDPRSESLDHLRDEGLVATVPLDERDRGVVLTDRGRELLDMHRRDRDDERGDRYANRVNRRELTDDASVYDAYRHATTDLRERDHARSRAQSRSRGSACRRHRAGRAHPAAHVLFAPGDAWRAGEGHPGARRTCVPLDDPALHAPESGGDRRRDPVARRTRIRRVKRGKIWRYFGHAEGVDRKFLRERKLVERATGIEPVSEAWEASVLPLY
jgi:hypothetical protein